MTDPRIVALAAAGLALAGCTLVTAGPPSAPDPGARDVTRADAVVAWVVDGDTLVVDGDVHVRLIGYDTPERDSCGYDEATALLAAAAAGRDVELVDPLSVQNTDSYGRLLRYVVVDGQDVGEMMLEAGLAVARYDGLDGYDPHPLQDLYRELDARHPHVCGID